MLKKAILIVPDEDWRGFLRLVLVKDYQVDLLEPNDEVNIDQLLGCSTLPDLIVMDVDVQDICALRLVDVIKTKEQFSCVNVVMISAIPASRQELCAGDAGAVLLAKPFTYQELKSVLNQFQEQVTQ